MTPFQAYIATVAILFVTHGMAFWIGCYVMARAYDDAGVRKGK